MEYQPKRKNQLKITYHKNQKQALKNIQENKNIIIKADKASAVGISDKTCYKTNMKNIKRGNQQQTNR